MRFGQARGLSRRKGREKAGEGFDMRNMKADEKGRVLRGFRGVGRGDYLKAGSVDSARCERNSLRMADQELGNVLDLRGDAWAE
jgi:hypothetical protein